jgi:hypothetical protein
MVWYVRKPDFFFRPSKKPANTFDRSSRVTLSPPTSPLCPPAAAALVLAAHPVVNAAYGRGPSRRWRRPGEDSPPSSHVSRIHPWIDPHLLLPPSPSPSTPLLVHHGRSIPPRVCDVPPTQVRIHCLPPSTADVRSSAYQWLKQQQKHLTRINLQVYCIFAVTFGWSTVVSGVSDELTIMRFEIWIRATGFYCGSNNNKWFVLRYEYDRHSLNFTKINPFAEEMWLAK